MLCPVDCCQANLRRLRHTLFSRHEQRISGTLYLFLPWLSTRLLPCEGAARGVFEAFDEAVASPGSSSALMRLDRRLRFGIEIAGLEAVPEHGAPVAVDARERF